MRLLLFFPRALRASSRARSKGTFDSRPSAHISEKRHASHSWLKPCLLLDFLASVLFRDAGTSLDQEKTELGVSVRRLATLEI